MTTKEERRQLALALIRDNIATVGWHMYAVVGPPNPHYAYTIGLSEPLGFELIFPGAYFYRIDDMGSVTGKIATKLKFHSADPYSTFNLGSYGSFSLREAHPSWTSSLMLGALDYYQQTEIQAFQIIPDTAHSTIDVPDMSESWNPDVAPIWRWLRESWNYPVPENSVALTNLAVLHGERITEAMRWEEDEWEIFAGDGSVTLEEDRRVIPLSTLIAADPTLEPILHVTVGHGLWREDEENSEWHPWQAKGEPA